MAILLLSVSSYLLVYSCLTYTSHTTLPFSFTLLSPHIPLISLYLYSLFYILFILFIFFFSLLFYVAFKTDFFLVIQRYKEPSFQHPHVSFRAFVNSQHLVWAHILHLLKSAALQWISMESIFASLANPMSRLSLPNRFHSPWSRVRRELFPKPWFIEFCSYSIEIASGPAPLHKEPVIIFSSLLL